MDRPCNPRSGGRKLKRKEQETNIGDGGSGNQDNETAAVHQHSDIHAPLQTTWGGQRLIS